MSTLSTLLLVAVIFIVALLMVRSLVSFVLDPDPTVKAGPMYVTLALTTGSALLMLLMALNASFLPILPRRRTPDVYLVTAAMGITGVVTGLLTVGEAASAFVTRLVLASMALMFIALQDARRARARAAAAAGQPAQPAPATQAPARPSSRQRRGGRKR